MVADLGVLAAQGSTGAVSPAGVSRPASHVVPAAGSAATSRAAQVSRHRPPQKLWVRATVATVWLHRGSAGRGDKPALAAQPNISRWIARTPLQVRQNFDRRVLTQALRGEPVTVLRRTDGWTKVRLVQQRGSYFRYGIPGWVPTRQLSTRPIPGHAYDRAVRRPTAAAELRIARGY